MTAGIDTTGQQSQGAHSGNSNATHGEEEGGRGVFGTDTDGGKRWAKGAKVKGHGRRAQ
jgi:hypothetical protein